MQSSTDEVTLALWSRWAGGLQRFRTNLAPTRHRYAKQKRDKQARERRFAGNGADGRERLSWLARGHDGLA
jgi:hypothetical protein